MRLVVGLTGGIGSGKSAAADEFARLGAPVIDTDAIAHELTGAGGAAIAEVRRLFGDALVDAAGAMDRKRMRELVFADAEKKRRLEALLHPMIRAESERRIAAAPGPYVVHVVPLLVDLRRKADEIRKAEIDKARSRLGPLTPEQERAIDAATAAIVNKLLHGPTVQLKEMAGNSQPEHVGFIRKLFGL